MIKRKLVKGAALLMLVAPICLGNLAGGLVASAAECQPVVETAEETNGSAREAQIVWVVKKENGKKYRRLYDATNEKWLTDWILCD